MRKSLMVPMVLFCTIQCFGQGHAGLAVGYDSWANSKPIIAGNFGVTIKHHLIIDGEIRPTIKSTTRSKNIEEPMVSNNYLGGKIGVDFINKKVESMWSVIPSIGGYYDHVSSDRRYLNKGYIGALLKIMRYISHDGSIFTEGLFIRKSIQLSVGMQMTFEK